MHATVAGVHCRLDLAEDILASAAWADTLAQTAADAMPIRVPLR